MPQFVGQLLSNIILAFVSSLSTIAFFSIPLTVGGILQDCQSLPANASDLISCGGNANRNTSNIQQQKGFPKWVCLTFDETTWQGLISFSEYTTRVYNKTVTTQGYVIQRNAFFKKNWQQDEAPEHETICFRLYSIAVAVMT